MKKSNLACTVSLIALVLVLKSSVALADGSVRTVALAGDPVPGTQAGVSFSSFSDAVVSSSGSIAFRAALSGVGVTSTNNSGVFSESADNGLSLVAREGDSAPGTGVGVNFSSFSVPVVNDSGITAFRALLTGTGVSFSNDGGIFSEGAGNGLSLIVREGSTAPGAVAGANFTTIRQPLLNQSGQTAFLGSLTGTGVTGLNNGGIYSEGGGNGLSLVAREGDPAPGTGSGFFTEFIGEPVFNDSGQTAFAGLFGGPTVSGTADGAIFSEGGGNGLGIVARQGDSAPDAGLAVFSLFDPPALNNSGQTAFSANLTGPGVRPPNSRGVFSEASGNGLGLVARGGNPALGTDDGASFLNFDSVDLNDSGQTAFIATLTGGQTTGSNDTGVFSEGGGDGLSLVAREGDAAPGAGVDVFIGFDAPIINSRGQTAFFGTLDGPGVIPAPGADGIWAEDLQGNLHLIAREGGMLDVNDDPLVDDFRTISTLSFSGADGNPSGRGIGFNDLGQLVFRASFLDGTSGVFVSDLVAVPEPSTLLLVAIASTGLLRRRASPVVCPWR